MGARRAIVVLALIGCCAGCAAPQPHVPAAEPASGRFWTWQSRKYANVVRQETDFTCGAASLSTISRYYYGRPILESQFTRVIRERYSDEEWHGKEKSGLSLLDMKIAAAALGFMSEGLKLTIDDAVALQGPVIVHLDKGYIKHFSVLRSIQGDRAYLADPVLGNVRIPVTEFARQWSGYALAVWIDGQALPHNHRLAISNADLTHEGPVARRFLYTQQPLPNANRL
ncbi:MAG: C39 family peptidase [Rhodospirillales bacterium]|nr:C39 family peptidase [Rhodospirillales bacterium]